MNSFSDLKLPSNRKFGIFVTVVFTIFSVYFFKESSIIMTLISFVVAIFIFIITLLKAELLFPFNKLWMQIGLFLGMIISPVILGIIFFGLFTPIVCFTRLFGRDELRLKFKNRKSYWKPKLPVEQSLKAFKNQF